MTFIETIETSTQIMPQFEGDRKPIRDRTSMDGQLPKSPKTIFRILQILPFHWVSGVFCRKPLFLPLQTHVGPFPRLEPAMRIQCIQKDDRHIGWKIPCVFPFCTVPKFSDHCKYTSRASTTLQKRLTISTIQR